MCGYGIRGIYVVGGRGAGGHESLQTGFALALLIRQHHDDCRGWGFGPHTSYYANIHGVEIDDSSAIC